MSERGPRMSEDTYIVEEKLHPAYYTRQTDAYRLGEQIQKAHEAGIRCQFYVYIPQLERREENLIIRNHELDREEKKDEPVSDEFAKQIFEVDGIYLVSNLRTSDRKLKIVAEAPGNNGKVDMKELDDSWEIFLDPVTADVLGIEAPVRREKKYGDENFSSISADILAKIDRTRHSLGLTHQTIKFRIEEKREKARIR